MPELVNPGPVATWLRSLYPTETQSRYWGPLQPDRLGEHHIGAVTRDDPSLLPHLLGSDNVNELQEAISSGLEAVSLYTELAELTPGFVPDLATSLLHVANLRLEAGEAATAVQVSQRAVDLLSLVLTSGKQTGTTPSASLTRFLASAEDTLHRARAAAWAVTTEKQPGPD